MQHNYAILLFDWWIGEKEEINFEIYAALTIISNVSS